MAASTGSAKPISLSPNASRLITRRCSRPAFRSTPIADLREASERAFAVLRAAAEKLVALMPAQGRPPALMVALHVWSMTHGIASLFGRGDAARRALPMPPEELLEAAVLIYLRGLGSDARPPAAQLLEPEATFFDAASGATPCGSPI